MTRPASRANFLPSDIVRAIKALDKAEKSLAAVDFPPEGGFRLLIGEPVTPTLHQPGASEWDSVLPQQ